MARGYTTLYDDRPAHRSHLLVPAPWLEFNSCDGAVVSTATDMARFMRMLLNGGRPLLSPASFELLYREVVPETAYGYGFISWEDEGIRYMGHAGDMPGYEAYMWMDYSNGLGVVLMCSQPAPSGLSWDVLHALQKAQKGEALPEFKMSDPTMIPNAVDYAGEYVSDATGMLLIAEDERLYLDLGGARVLLESRGPDTFLIPHPDFDLFLLEFERPDGENSPITAALHGPVCYTPAGAEIPETAHIPPEWAACLGHYRTWNPWESNFRVISRKGQLLLVLPDGETEALIPRPDGSFRLGEDERSPEWLRFDQIAEGQALRATLSGVDYYRFITP
jgi:hypothetical protein